MSRLPRILPLVGVAVAGVLGARMVSGAADLPSLLAGAKAWAEEAAPAPKAAKPDDKASSPMPANASLAPPPKPSAPACAPTAAELARQAGMSPAELQVLQSLGDRRGQLDQREKDMDVQLALLTAAETKLDAKLKTLASLKGDIQGLIGQADAQKQTEIDRLVRVYEAMKPKDAAARMTLLDDSVRLPLAAKMKERALSAVLAQMPAQDAKALTEKLATRLAVAEAARDALANKPVAAPAPVPAPAKAASPVAAPQAPAVAKPPAPAKPQPAAAPRPKPRPKPRPRPPAEKAPAAPAAPSAPAPKPTPAPTPPAKPSAVPAAGAPAAAGKAG